MTDENAKRSTNPLRAILDIRGNEWPLALTMFGYLFLVITTFWVLKPIKKSLFIGYYDDHGLDLGSWHLEAAQAELIAKVANMAVAFVAVVVFTTLSRRLQRERLTVVFAGFFVVTLALYSFVIAWPNDLVVWSFYLYGDLYSTIMVAGFFAFLNDIMSPRAAKRLYGPIVLGGVAGGAFGSTLFGIAGLAGALDAMGLVSDDTSRWLEDSVAGAIGDITDAQWLWITLGINVAVAVLAIVAGRLVGDGVVGAEPGEAKEPPKPEAAKEAPKSEGNPAIAGAQLVFRSPYLLSIVGIVGLYEIVSTIVDFQFTATIAHYLEGAAIGDQFATVFMITNVTSLIVQIFVTSVVMNRFPLTVALLMTPVVIIAASTGFLVLPILWVGSSLNTADNAFSYSINQSARETLWTPTSRDEKYKAKAFIDMFVQRFAKALAVGVTLLITSIFTDFSSVRWLSLIVLLFVAIWAAAALYGGRRFRAMTHEGDSR